VRFRPVLLVATALVAALVIGAAAFSIGRLSQPTSQARPGDSSAEAGFARDMQVHHNQGVELAMIVRDRTANADIRLLAYDIATSQGQQSGQLFGWLTEWGLSQAGTQPPMAWMMTPGSHDTNSAGSITSMAMPMPGLATAAQVAELQQSSGVEAERLFLRLMIAHHKGAIEMARAVLTRSDYPSVRAFADSVVRSQTAEIDAMTAMLTERS
jgi:Uncharacterized protein conserved in bacteria